MDSLLINNRITEGIYKNPNKTIANIWQVKLNSEEISLLKLEPKHGLLVRTKESDMIIIMEDIHD